MYAVTECLIRRRYGATLLKVCAIRLKLLLTTYMFQSQKDGATKSNVASTYTTQSDEKSNDGKKTKKNK